MESTPPPLANEPQDRSTHVSSPSDDANESFETSFASHNTDLDTSIDGENREKHPKARRKRTTPQDKKALEEAYLTNPKPDKLARLEIVSRVSLDEKEVQIWFQNRRQNDRRKSRPLSQQEIEALRFGAGGVQEPITTAPKSEADPAMSINMASTPPNTSPDVSRSSFNPINETPVRAGHKRSRSDNTTPPHQVSSQESIPGSRAPSSSFSSSVGYLANRWNPVGGSYSTPAPSAQGPGLDRSSIYLSHQTPVAYNQDCSAATPQSSSQSSSKSQVRLSLSIEGKAELVSNEISPSRAGPPRPSSTIPSLQRSQSAASISLPPFSSFIEAQQPTPPSQRWRPALPVPRLLHRNKSRDALAWEAAAGADTRDELTALAERESTGSATAAISFIRSSSGVLEPSNPIKRSSPFSERAPQKKVRLSRSASIVASLESIATAADRLAEGGKFRNGKVAISSMLVSPKSTRPSQMLVSPTDSDKENWSPDEHATPMYNRRRRPLPTGAPKSQNSRRVLQDTKTPSLMANRANTAPVRRRGGDKEGIDIFEEDSEKACDDVEKFMQNFTTPIKERGDGDLDCVEGLLSLRKGAWR